MNKILYDTHLHTEISTDSKTPIRAQIEQAIELGLAGICITDHMDYGFPKEEYPHSVSDPFVFDVDNYFQELTSVQKEYSSAIDVRIGIECGLQVYPDIVRYNENLCSQYPFDQIIGSIHLVEKKDPYYPTYWKEVSVKDGIKKYFETTLENISIFSDFDTLGHLDYIVRYAPDTSEYIPEDYFDIIDEILKIIIDKNIALEVNTSALKTTYGIINPHPDILRKYRELGGELITIGSDAHEPRYLAFGFDILTNLLTDIGFSSYVTFKNRQATVHHLF